MHPINTARNLLKNHYSSQATISLLVSDQEIPIDAIYTQLVIVRNEDIDKKKVARKKTRPGEDLNTPLRSAEQVQLEHLFQRGQAEKVLIQGDPGVGKSTLCHRIAYEWAKGELFPEFELVFWLRLRKLNRPGNLTLADYLHSECRINKELIDKVLKRKERILILLDGYDELPSANAPKDGNYRFILDELKQFPNVIITSRPHTNVNKFIPTLHLQITGFDEASIQHYIKQFFLGKPQKPIDALSIQLKKPLVKHLAATPINLEIFCSLAEADMPFFMDESSYTMSSLYMQLTSWLFTRFKIDRLHVDADLARESRDPRHTPEVAAVAQLLEKLAWEAMEQKTTHLPVEKIQDIANKQGLPIKQLKDVGFFSLTKTEGAFAHLTLQEYFAAGYLAHLYAEDPEKARQTLQAIKFNPHYRWVLCMAAGYLSLTLNSDMHKQQQLFFNDLFGQPYDLAKSYELDLIACCFEECKDPSTIQQYTRFMDVITKICDDLLNEGLIKDLLKSQKIMNNAHLMTLLLEQWQKERLDFMHLLARNLSSDRQTALLKYAGDILVDPKQIPLHRTIAAELIVTLFHDTHMHVFYDFSPLCDRFLDTQLNAQSRELAAQCLTLATQMDHHLAPKALDPLIAMLSDPTLDKQTRNNVAQITGRFIHTCRSLEPHILLRLKRIAENNLLSPHVRVGALKAIEYAVRHNAHASSYIIDFLIPMLSHSTAPVEVRVALVKTLGQCAAYSHILPSSMQDGLSQMAADPTLDVKLRIQAAAVSLQGFSFHPNLASLALLWDMTLDAKLSSHHRIRAVGIVINTYTHQKALDIWDEIPDTRQKTMDAWDEIPENSLRKVFDGLMKMVSDTSLDQQLRTGAAIALRKMAFAHRRDMNTAHDCLLQILSDMDISASNRRRIAENIVDFFPFSVSVDRLASIALDTSRDLLTRQGAISAITCITAEHPGIVEYLRILDGLLSDTSLTSQIRSEVALAINASIRDGYTLNTLNNYRLIGNIYDRLMPILMDNTLSMAVRSDILDTMGRFAQWGNPIEDLNTLHYLEALVADAMLDEDIRSKAAEIIGYVASTQGNINPRIPSDLLDMIMDASVSLQVSNTLVTTMGRIAQTNGNIGFDAFRRLIQITLNPDIPNKQRLQAADILYNFPSSYFIDHSNLNTEPLLALCSMTGRAFAYSQSGIHIVDQFEQVPVPSPNTSQLHPLIQRAEEWRQ